MTNFEARSDNREERINGYFVITKPYVKCICTIIEVHGSPSQVGSYLVPGWR